MGLCGHDVDLLLDVRQAGFSFQRTATIGHQSLFVHPSDRAHLERRTREVAGAPAAAVLADPQWGEYSDRVLRDVLGVRELTIVDASDYEGADWVHDMNRPIPDEREESFDVVVDGGSLEHIFDVRTALSNLMRMVRVGGSVVITTPANNLCGHGFYQFSPELMYRVFSAENGFETRSVRFVSAAYPSVELAPGRVYEVVDPAAVGERVRLVSDRPTMLQVWAVRTQRVTPFERAPQQSDYVPKWADSAAGAPRAQGPSTLGRVVGALPASMRRRLLGWRELSASRYSNRRFYQPRR